MLYTASNKAIHIFKALQKFYLRSLLMKETVNDTTILMVLCAIPTNSIWAFEFSTHFLQ
jgi:hypothetical protein